MNFKRIISSAAALVFALSPLSCSKKKDSSKKVADEPPVPIVEEEPTSSTTASTTTMPIETYPEVPVTYPAIVTQDTWDFYEAEQAQLSEGLKKENTKEKFSGEGYITGFTADGKGYVSFTVDAPSNQHYDLAFNIAADAEVNCQLTLNDAPLTSFKTKSDGVFTQIIVHGVFLTKGKSVIRFSPTDGNICLDYLRLVNSSTLSDISYDATGELSNKNAAEAAKDIMSFLSESYGKYIITGQYVSGHTNDELDLICRTTGKYPVIRFCELSVPTGSFDESFKDIEACADWYRNGGISCVSWFWASPSKKSSVRTEDSDFSLAKAVTDIDIALLDQEEIRGLYGEGKISEQCYGLILDIDRMAGELTSLKNKGVPVLWRPLPEGSGDWYWWGASGSDAYKWLWKLLYTRLTEYFELDNLIWIWNGQSADTLVDKSTFDIAAVDLYINDEKDYGDKFYERFAAVQKFVGKDKLIAISECGSVPDMDAAFRDNARWSFFGLWCGKYIQDEKGDYSEEFTSKENLIRCYNSNGALTLDEYRILCGYEKSEETPEATAPVITEPATAASTAPPQTEPETTAPPETASDEQEQ